MTLAKFFNLLYVALRMFSTKTTIGIYLLATGVVVLYTLRHNNITWQRMRFYAGSYLLWVLLLCAPPVLYLQRVPSIDEPINLPLLMVIIGICVSFLTVWLGQLGGMLILHSTIPQRKVAREWLHRQVILIANRIDPESEEKKDEEQDERIRKLEAAVNAIQSKARA